MYETHYGFSEKPFNLTPDPKYLYLSQRHTEAFAHLEFGRRERGGFIVITGEVGTGKTTLARYFLSRLDSGTATAFVIYPALTAAELMGSILQDLHVPVHGRSLKDHVDALHRFLLQARGEERDVVLLIDEAQDLSPEVLEQIRLLSNLETDTQKLIQIVLMGQSELQEMLARRELRQIAQRVTARYHLSPLSRAEAEEYVRHRLAVAGGEGKVNFTSGALDSVHRLSAGVPRLINLICDRALLAGYVQGTRVIATSMVVRAADELSGEPQRRWRRWRATFIGAGALAAAALAAFLWLRVGPARAGAGDAEAAAEAPLPAAPPMSLSERAAAQPSSAPVMPAALPQGPPLQSLEPLVLSLESRGSYDGALATIEALWGGTPVLKTPLRTHLDHLRRLDLPVVLEMFHPARRETCFIALLGLQGDSATVDAGRGYPLRVSVNELDRMWTRQALFVWKDYDAQVTALDAPRAAWTRDRLTRLGYADVDLTAAVERFQRDTHLTPDGVIGQRTLMTLYSLGGYPRPSLRGGA
jgi:general secretion pathway protein A